MAKSDARINEDARNALQGFDLAGQLKIREVEATGKDGSKKRELDFIGSTCTDPMRKLVFDYPSGTQFDIFIRKRE